MRTALIILTGLLLATIGCDSGPKSGRGFTLPDGNVAAGKEAFQRLNCHACHPIGDIKQLQPLEGEPEVTIALGGEVTRIRTYGELVTSIINPSHRFAKGYAPELIQTEEGASRMTIYNDTMTVTELIHIVAFLQSQYQLLPMPTTPYVPYY
jgi:hypothetical protein